VNPLAPRLRCRNQHRLALRDDQRVFIMRGQAPVRRADGPAVALQDALAFAGGDDGLDRDDQPLGELRLEPRIAVVQHLRRFVALTGSDAALGSEAGESRKEGCGRRGRKITRFGFIGYCFPSGDGPAPFTGSLKEFGFPGLKDGPGGGDWAYI
jgi:hypothetical protein